MNTAKAAAEFREAVRRAGPRGAGRRYPAAARRMAAEYFRQRRSAGATVASITRDLGVKRYTLAAWVAPPRAPERPRFVPVNVVADVPATRIVVHGPGGVRVEGLDVAGVVALLRGLA